MRVRSQFNKAQIIITSITLDFYRHFVYNMQLYKDIAKTYFNQTESTFSIRLGSVALTSSQVVSASASSPELSLSLSL